MQTVWHMQKPKKNKNKLLFSSLKGVILLDQQMLFG